ncbi:MAG: response regulator, partial [Deltaproteobacteria bacterium]|nr:response regulator [Deltaproteobacteria bacterium]
MTAHVLFVDDEEPNLVVFEAVCGDDFPVLTASSAEAGLQLMEEHEIGVVLTDQRMPGMTGIELLEKVETEYPDAIRLLITAYSDLQAAEDAINRGHVRRYMRKPWEPEVLRAELRDAIDLYNLNSRVKQLEQRLLETERAYSLSVVATGLADELRNPVGWIRNNLTVIETSIAAATAALEEATPNVTRARGTLAQVENAVIDARDGVKRILELTEEMAKAPEEVEAEIVNLADAVRVALRKAESSGLR